MADRSELLLTHYESTGERFRLNLKQRVYIGFGILFLLAILLLRASTPHLVDNAVKMKVFSVLVAEGNADGNTSLHDAIKDIDLSFVTTICWVALNSLFIMFLRFSMILDRQGDYLRRLENRLESASSGWVASEYLDLQKNRPLTFKVAQYSSVTLLMSMVFLSLGYVLINEFKEALCGELQIWPFVDLVIFLMMIVNSILLGLDFYRGRGTLNLDDFDR